MTAASCAVITSPGSRPPAAPTARASRTRVRAPAAAAGRRSAAAGCPRRHSTACRGSTCQAPAGPAARYRTGRRAWPAVLAGSSPASALLAAAPRAGRSAGAGLCTPGPDTPGSGRSRRLPPRGPLPGWSAGSAGGMGDAGTSTVAGPGLALAGRRREARVGADPRGARGIAEQFFDPQQLVVLRHSLAAGGRAGLDLPAVGRDGQVGDRGVIGFAGAVADHAAEP